MTAPGGRRRWSAWLRRGLLGVCGLTLCVGGAVALAPTAVSSTWFRGVLEARSSALLQRPLRVGALRLGWTDGLLLQDLSLGDAPSSSPEPLLRLGRLRVRLDLPALLRRRAAVDVALEGLAVRFLRNADGTTNWDPVLAALAPPKPPEPPKPPSRLPLDVTARVRCTGLSLDAEDRARAQGPGRRLSVTGGSLAVDAPSLRVEPVKVSLAAEVAVDGAPAAPIALDLAASQLYAADGLPTPERLAADARLSAPGLQASARARLARSELRADLRLDLAPLLALARPFLPPRVAATEAEGVVTLAAEASGAASPDIAAPFTVTLRAEGLQASGGVLPGRGLVPVTLSVANRGTFARAARELRVEEGELRLQTRTRARWSARATGLGGPEKRLKADLGPALLDLREVLALAAPFLGPGAVPELGRGRGAPAELALGALGFDGRLDGNGRATAGGLRLAVPNLGLGPPPKRLSASSLSLDLARASADLARWFPSAARLEGGLRLGALRRGRLRVERFDLSGLQVSARSLRRSPDGPFGLRGILEAREDLSLGRLEAEGLAVAGLRQSLRGQLTLGPGSAVDARVDELRVAVRSAATGAGFGPRVAVSRGKAGGEAVLEVRGARLAGPLKGGANPVSVGRLAASLPGLTVRRGADAYALRGLDLGLSDAVAVLRDGFPESAGLTASLRLGGLDATGTRRAAAEGLVVENFAVSAAGLRRRPAALFGVAGRVALKESLTLRSLSVPGLARLLGFAQGLDASAELGDEVRARLGVLRASAGSVRWEDAARGPLEAPLELEASADSLRLRGPGTPLADVDGLRARLGLGPLLSASATASVRGSGRDAVATAGRLEADLDRLPRRLVASVRPGLRLGGRASWTWDVAGRLPRPGEVEAWRAPSRGPPAPFLDRAELGAALRGLLVRLPLAEGGTFAASGITTLTPATLSLGRGGSGARARLRAEIGAVEELPSVARLDLPPRAVLSLDLSGDLPRSLKVRQSLEVDLLRLRQGLDAEVAGFDRVVERALERPWPALLDLVDADLRATLEAGEEAGRVVAGPDLSWDGPLSTAVRVRLAPARQVAVTARVESSGLDAAVGRLARVQGLRAHLSLDKTLRLAAPSAPAPGRAGGPLLSRAVLEPPSLDGAPRPGGAGSRALADALRPQFRGPPSLSFSSARVQAGGLDLDLGETAVDLRLVGGLPVLDRFRTDLLGGTVVGSAAVASVGDDLPLTLRLGFTGLDGRRLAPEALRGAPGAETELGGQLALAAPLASTADRLLAEAAVDLRLAPIGRRALDGFLFGLDPTGSNEALAGQRRLLRTATPRWVRVGVRDGRLSLGGQAEVKGVGVGIPPIEGVNLAELPGRAKLERSLAKLEPLVAALRLASADTLEVSEGGAVRLTRRAANPVQTARRSEVP